MGCNCCPELRLDLWPLVSVLDPYPTGILIPHGIESLVRLIHPRKNEAKVLLLLIVVLGCSCAVWRQLGLLRILCESFDDKLDGDAL